MPIMAAHERSDARGSARLLANAAIKCVDDGSAPPHQLTSINNLYRLLESYRCHRFLGFEYEPRFERGAEALTLLPSAERHVLDLRDALEKAFREVYQGEDIDRAVGSVEDVLRSVAYPETRDAEPAMCRGAQKPRTNADLRSDVSLRLAYDVL